MLFRLVRPMRREGSRLRYFVKRIPADLRGQTAGLTLDLPIGPDIARIKLTASSQAVRVSLRSAEPAEVKERHSALDAFLDKVWAGLRAGKPVPLSHIQATALAGEVYRAWASAQGSERTTAIELTSNRKWVASSVSAVEDVASWDAAAVHIASSMDEYDQFGKMEALEDRFGPILDRLMLAKGVAATDQDSRETALLAIGRALREAFERRRANAGGDYSQDENAKRFPAWPTDAPSPPSSNALQPMRLSTLVEDWWVEAKAAGRSRSTYESYRNTMKRLREFLGHDDAGKVTSASIIAFKDARIAAGISPNTVKDSDLAGLKSVFQRAVQNGQLRLNPALGVSVLRVRSVRLRSKSFSTEEAAKILTHASAYVPSKREAPKTAAAKRWVPWLCAYTGARLGEIAQLRRRDVRLQGGLWVITVTPEAGTVKDKQAREVVVHQHLIDEGFAEFVQAAGTTGHLFYGGNEGDDLRGRWRSIKNRLVDFVREVVPDENVAPNHGWRHLFKTIGHEYGIDSRVLDAIQGHAPTSEGGKYGEVTLQAKAQAMRLYPRYDLGPKGTEAP